MEISKFSKPPTASGAGLRALAHDLVWLLNPGTDAQYYSPFAGDDPKKFDTFHERLMKEPDVVSLHEALYAAELPVPDNWDKLNEEHGPEDWEAINAHHRKSWQAIFDAKVAWVADRIEAALNDPAAAVCDVAGWTCEPWAGDPTKGCMTHPRGLFEAAG